MGGANKLQGPMGNDTAENGKPPAWVIKLRY